MLPQIQSPSQTQSDPVHGPWWIKLWFGLLAVVSVCSPLRMVAINVTELKGTLVVHQYGHHNEVTAIREGTFHLAFAPEFYAVRMLKPTEFVEQGMFVVSDGESVYQTQRLRKIGGEQEVPVGPYAVTVGKCRYGKMPTGFYGWGPMEAIALSYYLFNHPNDVFSGGEIRKEYIPEIIITRSRELRHPYVRVDVTRDASGFVSQVKFWGLTSENSAVPYSHRDDCFLLGELNLKEFRHGAAEKVTFVVNGLLERPVAGKPRHGSPLVDVELQGVAEITNDRSLFLQVAYDSGVSVEVGDSRFPDTPSLHYVVHPQQGPPLAGLGAQTGSAPQKAREERLAKVIDARSKRRATVLVAGLASLLVVAMTILRTRAERRKQHTDITTK